MGQVINLSEGAVNMALYGDRSQFLQSYIGNQISNLQPFFTDIGNRLVSAAQASYNYVTDTLTKTGILNELSNKGMVTVDNFFQELLDWEALQQANLTMQRYVMAHPTLRQYYLDDNIDGYSDSYQSLEETGVGETHYDYRRATNGMILESEGEEDTWTCTHYFEDLLPGDRELEEHEKHMLYHTYRAIDFMLKGSNFDFTSNSEVPKEINN